MNPVQLSSRGVEETSWKQHQDKGVIGFHLSQPTLSY